jgi:hypothetical protein
LDDPRYIVGGAADNRASPGALLALLLIIANIGTAAVLYRVVTRVNEILAAGFATARVVECAFIGVGILGILGVRSLVTCARRPLRARMPARSSRSASGWSRSTTGRSCSDPASSSASETG